MPFLVFEIADLIRAEKESFESRIIRKCLCSLTFFTGNLLRGLLDDLIHVVSLTVVVRQLALVDLD